MSKSTPISELQNDANVSTKPLVQDILQEIQQEQDKTSEPVYEMPPPSQGGEVSAPQNPPPSMENQQMVDNSDPNEYAQQQEQALQYQLDPNVNNPIEGGQVEMSGGEMGQNQVQENFSSSPQAGPQQDLQDISLQNQGVPSYTPGSFQQKTLSQKIFEQARDPLLVLLLTILLSVPIVQQFLLRFISKIPGSNRVMVPIIIKALLMAILFYAIRKLF